MKRFTKGQTLRLANMVSQLHAAETIRCDSDARDEYEHLTTCLAALLVIYGATADIPHST